MGIKKHKAKILKKTTLFLQESSLSLKLFQINFILKERKVYQNILTNRL